MLNRKDKSLKDIVRTLKIYHDNVDDERGGANSRMEVDTDDKDSERAPSQREILEELIAYLEHC